METINQVGALKVFEYQMRFNITNKSNYLSVHLYAK